MAAWDKRDEPAGAEWLQGSLVANLDDTRATVCTLTSFSMWLLVDLHWSCIPISMQPDHIQVMFNSIGNASIRANIILTVPYLQHGGTTLLYLCISEVWLKSVVIGAIVHRSEICTARWWEICKLRIRVKIWLPMHQTNQSMPTKFRHETTKFPRCIAAR